VNPPAVETEPSVTHALERVFAASQRVVQDRTELVFLEVRELLASTFEGLLALGLAIGLLLLAWVSATAMMVFLLIEVIPRSSALGVVAIVNLVVGGVLMRVAMSKAAAARTIPAARAKSEVHAA
jgi:uncharacterized membrane protein YqjE